MLLDELPHIGYPDRPKLTDFMKASFKFTVKANTD